MKSLVLFLVIITLCLSINVSSQTTAYEDGFVILKSGDSLFGQVKDRSAEPFGQLYKKIKLKVEGRWFPKRYHPSDLKAYQKGTTYFESVWFKEDAQFFNSTYRSIDEVGDEVFMKVILSGTLTYYQLEWRNPDSGYYLYTPFLKKENKDHFVRVTKGVFGLRRKDIANYLADDPKLAKQILSGEKLSALQITELYNQAADKN